MILREFQICADQWPSSNERPIHDQTRCVLSLFESYLPRIRTENIWKVDVELSEAESRSYIPNALGVAMVRIQHDYHSFYALTPEEKKRLALDWLEEGLAIACSYFGWHYDPFASAADAVRAADFTNRYVFDSKWNPSRRFKAYLQCEHETAYFRGELRVETREGDVVAASRQVDELPSEFCFAQYLGRVKWLDRRQVVLLDRQGSPVGSPISVSA